jgi:hypothetical protein
VKPANSLDELDTTAIECRAIGHDWPRANGVEYQFTKTTRGAVAELVMLLRCRGCGTVAKRTYAVVIRHGRTEFDQIGGTVYSYPSDRPYLISGSEFGGHSARPAARGLLAARMFEKTKFGQKGNKS